MLQLDDGELATAHSQMKHFHQALAKVHAYAVKAFLLRYVPTKGGKA